MHCRGTWRGQELGRHRSQAPTQRQAGIANGATIQVRPGRRRRGRRVRHLVRARRHHPYRCQAHTQNLRRHLRHLDLQALSHLRSTVVDLDASIAVDQHKCACLVQERGGERDAKLDRRNRDAPPNSTTPGIRRPDCLASRNELPGLLNTLPDGHEPVVTNLLPIVGGVGLARPAIQVACPDVMRVHANRTRRAVDDLLGDCHALGPTEPPECGL